MLKIPKVILLIERSRSFGQGLLYGINQYSNLHGPWLCYMEPEFYRQAKSNPKNWFKDLDADGVIAHTWDPSLLDILVDLGIPAIIRGPMEKGKSGYRVYPLLYDEAGTGRMAAEYFIKRDFRNFAYCGFDTIWSKQKGDGFKQTLEEVGFQAFIYHQPAAKNLRKPAKEQPIIANWLAPLPKPLALMACNDDRALDVLAACKIAKLNVPEDVAILGVDNDKLLCNFSYPRLSSITLSTERAGYEAAKLLDKMMKGEKISKNKREVTILPLRVVNRQSTDTVAIEDKFVAGAVSFIRRNVRTIIQVDDVARAVGLSRRSLENSFRKTLSHSIHYEIKLARVNEMANLLIGTELPVSKIALLIGYQYDAKNISRYFRRLKGMSPLEYRKKFAPK